MAGIKVLRKAGLGVLTIAQIGLLFQIAGLIFVAFANSSTHMFLGTFFLNKAHS